MLEGKVAITVRIDKGLHKDFKILCVQKDVDIKDQLTRLVYDWVEQNKRKGGG